MNGAYMRTGDIVVVDWALTAVHNKIVVARVSDYIGWYDHVKLPPAYELEPNYCTASAYTWLVTFAAVPDLLCEWPLIRWLSNPIPKRSSRCRSQSCWCSMTWECSATSWTDEIVFQLVN